MDDREVQKIAFVIAKELGSGAVTSVGLPTKRNPDDQLLWMVEAADGAHYEVSPRDKDDEQRRDAHDASQDPWGYDDPPQERTDD